MYCLFKFVFLSENQVNKCCYGKFTFLYSIWVSQCEEFPVRPTVLNFEAFVFFIKMNLINFKKHVIMKKKLLLMGLFTYYVSKFLRIFTLLSPSSALVN